MWREIYFCMASSHFVVKHFILRFWGSILSSFLLLTVSAVLDYLNNLQVDQHSWVPCSFSNYFIFHTCLPQKTLFGKRSEYCVVPCLGLFRVTSFNMNVLHECTYYRILRNEVLVRSRGWSGLVLLWQGILLHFAVTECDYWKELTSQLSSWVTDCCF